MNEKDHLSSSNPHPDLISLHPQENQVASSTSSSSSSLSSSLSSSSSSLSPTSTSRPSLPTTDPITTTTTTTIATTTTTMTAATSDNDTSPSSYRSSHSVLWSPPTEPSFSKSTPSTTLTTLSHSNLTLPLLINQDSSLHPTPSNLTTQETSFFSTSSTTHSTSNTTKNTTPFLLLTSMVSNLMLESQQTKEPLPTSPRSIPSPELQPSSSSSSSSHLSPTRSIPVIQTNTLAITTKEIVSNALTSPIHKPLTFVNKTGSPSSLSSLPFSLWNPWPPPFFSSNVSSSSSSSSSSSFSSSPSSSDLNPSSSSNPSQPMNKSTNPFEILSQSLKLESKSEKRVFLNEERKEILNETNVKEQEEQEDEEAEEEETEHWNESVPLLNESSWNPSQNGMHTLFKTIPFLFKTNDGAWAFFYLVGLFSVFVLGLRAWLINTSPLPSLSMSLFLLNLKHIVPIFLALFALLFLFGAIWILLLGVLLKPLVFATFLCLPIVCLGFAFTSLIYFLWGLNPDPNNPTSFHSVLPVWVWGVFFLLHLSMGSFVSLKFYFSPFLHQGFQQTLNLFHLCVHCLSTNPSFFIFMGTTLVASTSLVVLLMVVWYLTLMSMSISSTPSLTLSSTLSNWIVPLWTGFMFTWTSRLLPRFQAMGLACMIHHWYFTQTPAPWKQAWKRVLGPLLGTVCYASFTFPWVYWKTFNFTMVKYGFNGLTYAWVWWVPWWVLQNGMRVLYRSMVKFFVWCRRLYRGQSFRLGRVHTSNVLDRTPPSLSNPSIPPPFHSTTSPCTTTTPPLSSFTPTSLFSFLSTSPSLVIMYSAISGHPYSIAFQHLPFLLPSSMEMPPSTDLFMSSRSNPTPSTVNSNLLVWSIRSFLWILKAWTLVWCLCIAFIVATTWTSFLPPSTSSLPSSSPSSFSSLVSNTTLFFSSFHWIPEDVRFHTSTATILFTPFFFPSLILVLVFYFIWTYCGQPWQQLLIQVLYGLFLCFCIDLKNGTCHSSLVHDVFRGHFNPPSVQPQQQQPPQQQHHSGGGVQTATSHFRGNEYCDGNVV